MNDKTLISFDYAIKYLLKDKKGYEIIEGFISALLKSLDESYKDVKIIALLETESNEDNMQKRSLADLLVEDEDHRKYIIEIERNIQKEFKECFNPSRLIVDQVKCGTDYNDIIKVFHISILYFPIGNEPIHHGKTTINGLESKEKLTVHIRDPLTNIVTDVTNILPEYLFISVPLFNDRLKTEMDEWLYVMKHDNVPENFKSPYMEKVKERLTFLKMTRDERNEYIVYRKKIISDQDSIKTAKEVGREEGREEERLKNAKDFIRMGLPLDQVVKGAKLSVEIVQKLAEEVRNEDKQH